MKLRFAISLFILSVPFLTDANAKRPSRNGLSQSRGMGMPDLQSVLGGAYQAPLELSDRATPGAVIEVTEFGYRPIVNDCVGEKPVESTFTNITMQSSLSGGVSYGIGGQGMTAKGNNTVGLKFISPYILGFEMIRFKPSRECRQALEAYGEDKGYDNLVVVQEALFARINGCSEASGKIDGKVGGVGGYANASTSCQMFSNEPVAVGVRLVELTEFLGLNSASAIEAKHSPSTIAASSTKQKTNTPVRLTLSEETKDIPAQNLNTSTLNGGEGCRIENVYVDKNLVVINGNKYNLRSDAEEKALLEFFERCQLKKAKSKYVVWRDIHRRTVIWAWSMVGTIYVAPWMGISAVRARNEFELCLSDDSND